MRYLYSFFVSLSIIIFIQTTHSTAPVQPTISIAQEQEHALLNFFLKPITFSEEGIAFFFKQVYNHEEYPNFLGYNFTHCIQFLHYGQQSNQSQLFAKSVIKLFSQKVKGADYINAYALLEMLPKLQEALTPYMQHKDLSMLEQLQTNMKQKLVDIFSNYFSLFKKNPDSFLTALSQKLATMTNQAQTQVHVDKAYLQKDVVCFLELIINKLVWSPQEALEAWLSINKMALLLRKMVDENIIPDQESLDSLLWSLLHRFSYFLKISGDQISISHYRQMLYDLKSAQPPVFQTEEQEDLITTKKDHLIAMMKKAIYNKKKAEQPEARPLKNILTTTA